MKFAGEFLLQKFALKYCYKEQHFVSFRTENFATFVFN